MSDNRKMHGPAVKYSLTADLQYPETLRLSYPAEVRDRISATFQDIGDQQLKNISRPVRAFSCYRSSRASEDFAVGDINAPPAPPDKPSLAVLPLTNMSGDPEQEFVSDGLAE